MRKVVSLITAVLLCVSLASTVFADGVFVPSIPAKDAPDVVVKDDPSGNPSAGTIVDSEGAVTDHIDATCVIITSVAQANTSTQIPEEAKENLLNVYEQLSNGTMELPYGSEVKADEMVIKDLFDVSWACTDHPEEVKPEGVSVEITLDVKVASTTDVVVMGYIDSTWVEITSVKNNSDGTITCVLEDFCLLAVSVPTDTISDPSDTGDNSNLILWGILMAASAVGVVALVVIRRRSMMSK